jgi:hypothetical protein
VVSYQLITCGACGYPEGLSNWAVSPFTAEAALNQFGYESLGANKAQAALAMKSANTPH